MDYSAWVERAKKFVGELSFPDESDISVEVAPPLSDKEADALNESLPLGLPKPLREFYTTGSADIACSYYWSPHEDSHASQLDELLYSYSLYGGPSIIPAQQLAPHGDFIDWIDEDEHPEAFELADNSVPFIAVGNGDYVTLQVESESVLYFCHETPEAPIASISPSFEQFMTDWERLCYLHPMQIGAFYGPDGMLDLKQENVEKWREFIETFQQRTK